MKYEEKFIVINKKRFEEYRGDATNRFLKELTLFIESYERNTGKKMNQKYIVCNQDEAYAGNVLSKIMEGEDKKNG